MGPGTYETRTRYYTGYSYYRWAVIALRPGVTVQARGGPDVTFVARMANDPPGLGGRATVFSFAGQGTGAVLDGFTLEADTFGAFWFQQCSNLTVRNCRVVGSGGFGDADAVDGLVFEDCVFDFDVSDDYRRLWARDTNIRFQGCASSGAMVRLEDGNAAFEDCDFRGLTDAAGAILQVFGAPTSLISNCTFTGGVAGVSVRGDEGVVRECQFVDFRFAVSCGSTSVHLEGNAIVRSENCVWAFNGSTVIARNNVFAFGTADQYPALVQTTGTYQSSCNLFWANPGGNAEPGVLGPTDLVDVDPQFCDAATGDYTLSEDSPAIAGTCGQIGAFGIGCGTVSLNATSWSRVKALYRDAESPPPSGR